MELQTESKRDSKGLIPPYGGNLKDLIVKDENLKGNYLEKLLMRLNVAREMHVMLSF